LAAAAAARELARYQLGLVGVRGD